MNFDIEYGDKIRRRKKYEIQIGGVLVCRAIGKSGKEENNSATKYALRILDKYNCILKIWQKSSFCHFIEYPFFFLFLLFKVFLSFFKCLVTSLAMLKSATSRKLHLVYNLLINKIQNIKYIFIYLLLVNQLTIVIISPYCKFWHRGFCFNRNWHLSKSGSNYSVENPMKCFPIPLV